MIMLLTLPLYPSLLIVLTCDSNNLLACLNAIIFDPAALLSLELGFLIQCYSDHA